MSAHTQLLTDTFTVELLILSLTVAYLAAAAYRGKLRSAFTLSALHFTCASTSAPRRVLHSITALEPYTVPVPRLNDSRQTSIARKSARIRSRERFGDSRFADSNEQSNGEYKFSGKKTSVAELQLLRDYKLAIQSHLARFFEVGRLISSPKRSLSGQRVARFA